MTRIIIVDDHKILRQGLSALLGTEPDFSVVAEAGNGVDALPLIQTNRPDVVVSDLRMTLMNGIELTREIMKCLPQTKIIILSMYGSDGYVREALDGASGYILKDLGLNELAWAIREVMNGSLSDHNKVITALHLRGG